MWRSKSKWSAPTARQSFHEGSRAEQSFNDLNMAGHQAYPSPCAGNRNCNSPRSESYPSLSDRLHRNLISRVLQVFRHLHQLSSQFTSTSRGRLARFLHPKSSAAKQISCSEVQISQRWTISDVSAAQAVGKRSAMLTASWKDEI